MSACGCCGPADFLLVVVVVVGQEPSSLPFLSRASGGDASKSFAVRKPNETFSSTIGVGRMMWLSSLFMVVVVVNGERDN
jgi:hypothetical protein